MENYERIATPAERIKQALSINNMKQVELAEKTGVDRASICSYIKGKYEPKQKALNAMGKALNVSEMWLAGYNVPMERPAKQKENDELTDMITRIRTDAKFRNAVLAINKLDITKIENLLNLLGLITEESK